MPGDDLVALAGDGAAEPTELEGHVAVGEVARCLVDPLSGELVVGLVVDLTHDFLGVPREPDLASWVAGAEQSHQVVVLVVGQSFRASTSRRRAR